MKSPAEFNGYRKKLLQMMARLDQDRNQLRVESLRPGGGEAGGGLSNVPIHCGDLGNQEGEQVVNLLLVENEEQLLREINEALDRLQDGTFGRCESCRQKISRQRLQVLPHTRYCIHCAREMESVAPS